MTYGLAMRRIVLPQAARVIVPPLGNEFNNMLKTTSLLFVISRAGAVRDRSQNKNGSGPTVFHPFELFLACGGLVPAADDDLGRRPGLDRATARHAARPALRARARARRAAVGPPTAAARCGACRAGALDMARSVRTSSTSSVRRQPQTTLSIAARRPQVVRPARGAEGDLARGRRARGRAASSARPDRARRRSCAASTTSRRSTAARISVNGHLIGYREVERRARRGPRAEHRPPAAARSAWSSSASTCSRT